MRTPRLVNEMRQTNDVLANVSGQLAKYIPPQLYQSIIAGEQRAAIESRRKKLTVFFSDIVDFTEITDQLESEELTSLLNEYLSEMSRIAVAHDAYFDKFIGDVITHPLRFPTHSRFSYARVAVMVWNGGWPVSLAVSTTVLTAQSPWAAHIERKPLVTLRWMTAGRSARSQALLVTST